MALRVFAFSLLISILAILFPSSTEKSIGPTSKTATKQTVGTCFLPADPGMCMANIPRFYFNHKTKKCDQFIYGGCGGNQNNFLNEAACKFKCASASPQAGNNPILAKKSFQYAATRQPTIKIIPTTKLKPCLLEKQKALASNQNGTFLPECTKDGDYLAKQCWTPLGLPKRCWCVDKQGSKVGDVTKMPNGRETCNSHRKTKREESECMALFKLYHESVPANQLKYMYVPQCDDYNGLFKQRQCHQDTCWCVDVYTGSEIKDSFGSKRTLKCT